MIVPVTTPAQASIATGVIVRLTAVLMVAISLNTGGTGEVLSTTLTIWVAVVLLPFPSSNNHVTIKSPTAKSLNGVVDLYAISPTQLSVVVATVVILSPQLTVNGAKLGESGGTLSEYSNQLLCRTCVTILIIKSPSNSISSRLSINHWIK